MPSAEEAVALELAAGAAVLHAIHTARADDGTVLEVAESLWPADRNMVIDDYPIEATAEEPSAPPKSETSMTDASAPELTHAEQVHNHWWWRPGWHHGRRFYTWHLTFEHQPQLHALVDAYQRQLADLSGLDLIPREWLHLTMQGIGFVDEVDDHQVEQLVRAAQRRLAALPAAEVTFHRLLLRPEAIVLPASPPEHVLAIRDAIRSAFDDTRLGDAPGARDGLLPHISLAYVNRDGPAEPITAASPRSRPRPQLSRSPAPRSSSSTATRTCTTGTSAPTHAPQSQPVQHQPRSLADDGAQPVCYAIRRPRERPVSARGYSYSREATLGGARSQRLFPASIGGGRCRG